MQYKNSFTVNHKDYTTMFKLLTLLALCAVAIATPFKRLPSIRPNGGRIVGGVDTTIEEIPYQVALLAFGNLFCGGSIISKNWIVTAGHCAGNPSYIYQIRAGSTSHQYGGSLHEVAEIIRHERYGTNNNGLPLNDIALMRVKKPFNFDESRQPIQLFQHDEESTEGSISVITGWGNTLSGFPETLQRVEVPIISKNKCDESYSGHGGLPDGQICAAYPEGGKDACQGDSGGPLAIDGRLAGITSWGVGCAQPGNPGVYTEVSAHRSWIQRNIDV